MTTVVQGVPRVLVHGNISYTSTGVELEAAESTRGDAIVTIIVSKGGLGATRVQESGVPKEGFLEGYVANNPESLPFEDIKEDVKLLILARQFGTHSGPIDVLAADGEGDIYIIETKLFRNPDKRQVVAQVLDYGASLWREYGNDEGFLAAVEDRPGIGSGGVNARLRDTFGYDDEAITAFRNAVRQNIKEGNLRFVVLMDTLHDRLKDLILFLNERSRFAIYAVEMRFYRHEGYEIVIPKLFGAEVDNITVSGRSSWNEERFFADAREHLSSLEVAALQKLYRFCRETGADIRWGTGVVKGSFNPRYPEFAGKSIFTANSTGALDLNFQWLHDSDEAIAFRDRYAAAIQQSGFAALPADYAQKFVTLRDWHPRVDNFLQALKSVLGKP